MSHAFDLTEDQRLVQKTVREFVDRDVMPVASDMEHRDEYPEALVETMKGMGLADILGSNLVLCDVPVRFGTDAQKKTFLPGLARGEPRGGICLSEPGAGTDLQRITTTAVKRGSSYIVNGSKMWVTNGRRAQ